MALLSFVLLKFNLGQPVRAITVAQEQDVNTADCSDEVISYLCAGSLAHRPIADRIPVHGYCD